MKFNDQIWKYATVIVVLIFIINPEMVKLAFFIDAVGLEMFLMLVEVQIVAIFGVFYNSTIKPVFIYVKDISLIRLPNISWKDIKEKPESLALVVPSPAMLMNVLVILTMMDIIFYVH